jgi:hypothetical protein
MFKMIAKSILNDLESSSQDEIQTNHLQNGLRILARIIARDLLNKYSDHTKKKDVEADDTQALADS